MKTLNEMINQMAFTCDKSLVKGRDLVLFNAVVDYLKSQGLSVRVAGSAVTNFKNGSPRQYGDIDLVVSGKNAPVVEFMRAAYGLQGGGKSVYDVLPAGTSVRSVEGIDSSLYVNTMLDNRFKIANGETEIDVCFVRMPKTLASATSTPDYGRQF